MSGPESGSERLLLAYWPSLEPMLAECSMSIAELDLGRCRPYRFDRSLRVRGKSSDF